MGTKGKVWVVTVRVSEALHREVHAKAKLVDITVSQVVRKALREFVKDGDDSNSAA